MDKRGFRQRESEASARKERDYYFVWPAELFLWRFGVCGSRRSQLADVQSLLSSQTVICWRLNLGASVEVMWRFSLIPILIAVVIGCCSGGSESIAGSQLGGGAQTITNHSRNAARR
jgi:hypothetical protein